MTNRLSLFMLCLISASMLAEENVITVTGAKGDGKTDDTAAFQAALNKAEAKGGIVSVPAGQFRINGTLSIPREVTLSGVYRSEHTSNIHKGTTLLAYAGRDHEDSTPFISLATSSAVTGLTIYYPEQQVGDIHPYPWTIQGRGQHYDVIDVTIANAYNGIDCGTFHNEGHHLRNVFMCALRRGVLIDQCSDIGRLENVHIHNVYWWRINTTDQAMPQEQVQALERYTLANLEGFIIGRTDWQYISNCFVIWAKVGYHFTKLPSKYGGPGNVLITQSGSDIGPLAVQVDEVQGHAGIAFENCQFMSGFNIAAGNSGPVKLSNCGFWGAAGAGSQMVLEGQGTVFLSNCHFSEWDAGKACIQALQGSLLMSNCDFVAQGGQHLLLGPGLSSASITGTRFRREPQIVNQSSGEVVITGNLKR